MAKGLAFQHDYSPRRCVHGDLRPTNILLGPNLESHVSDLGLSRMADIVEQSPDVQWKHSTTGTPQLSSPYAFTVLKSTMCTACYQAVEALKVRKPTRKWDVNSYGVILPQMISGKLPMIQIGSAEMKLVQWIQVILEDKKPMTDALDPFLVHHLDKEEHIASVLNITLDCIHKSPETRPSIRHVCDSLDIVTTLTRQQFMPEEPKFAQ